MFRARLLIVVREYQVPFFTTNMLRENNRLNNRCRGITFASAASRTGDGLDKSSSESGKYVPHSGSCLLFRSTYIKTEILRNRRRWSRWLVWPRQWMPECDLKFIWWLYVNLRLYGGRVNIPRFLGLKGGVRMLSIHLSSYCHQQQPLGLQLHESTYNQN